MSSYLSVGLLMSLCMYIYVSISSLCLSACLFFLDPNFLSPFLSICMPPLIFVCFSLCVGASLCRRISVCLSLSLNRFVQCISLYLSVSPPLSVSLSFPVSASLCDLSHFVFSLFLCVIFLILCLSLFLTLCSSLSLMPHSFCLCLFRDNKSSQS